MKIKIIKSFRANYDRPEAHLTSLFKNGDIVEEGRIRAEQLIASGHAVPFEEPGTEEAKVPEEVPVAKETKKPEKVPVAKPEKTPKPITKLKSKNDEIKSTAKFSRTKKRKSKRG